MAKVSTPAPDGATDTARSPEPTLRVTSPGGPHWRAGRQFGREPIDLTKADVEAMAKTKGVKPEAILEALSSDPQLAVVPPFVPIAGGD